MTPTSETLSAMPPPPVPASSGSEPGPRAGPPLYGLAPEDVPNLDNIVIDDGKPVDNVFSEKNMRLLTEPLYSSWAGPGDGRPFVALANVGLFHTVGQAPLVPDVMLSLDAAPASDLSQKGNLSYFVWLRGKVPDAVIEIVSNREGGEDDSKLRDYARLKILYYIIFDPENLLKKGVLRIHELHGRKYRLRASNWLEEVGLGLTLWTGIYEDMPDTWLRWCDRDGNLILTGAEGREKERQRAEEERQRAEAEHQMAEEERQRAEEERQRAAQAKQEVERLRAKLRELGIEDPS